MRETLFGLLVVGVLLTGCDGGAEDEAAATGTEAETEAEAEAETEAEAEPAEPEGPTPQEAAKQLGELGDDASADEAGELIRTALEDGGECAQCVDAVVAIATDQEDNRIAKNAMRALVKVEGHDDAICGLYIDILKNRKSSNSSPSASAISVLGQRTSCSDHYDAVVDEIVGRFEAHDDYGALTAGHVLYVKRFVDGNEALTDAQKKKIVDAAKTLAKEGKGATASTAEEIAAL